VKVDPFYNPNLILTAENFSLANHAVYSAHHGYPLDSECQSINRQIAHVN
jgi:hypothetical protein